VVLFFGLILHLVHKWQNYQVLMNPCLFHGFLSIFMAISYQPSIFFVVEGFFEEPHQIVYLGVVEGRVWFTSSKMLH
jgi:hypothetical protein